MDEKTPLLVRTIELDDYGKIRHISVRVSTAGYDVMTRVFSMTRPRLYGDTVSLSRETALELVRTWLGEGEDDEQLAARQSVGYGLWKVFNALEGLDQDDVDDA